MGNTSEFTKKVGPGGGTLYIYIYGLIELVSSFKVLMVWLSRGFIRYWLEPSWTNIILELGGSLTPIPPQHFGTQWQHNPFNSLNEKYLLSNFFKNLKRPCLSPAVKSFSCAPTFQSTKHSTPRLLDEKSPRCLEVFLKPYAGRKKCNYCVTVYICIYIYSMFFQKTCSTIPGDCQ